MISNLPKALNTRIIVHSITEIANEAGVIEKMRVNFGDIWANIEVLSDKYWLDFGKRNNSTVYKITARLFKEVKVGNYVEYEGRSMLISSVKHDEQNDFITEIIAEDRKEGINQ